VKHSLQKQRACKAPPLDLLRYDRFRWVECQLGALRKCLKPAALRKALDRLPTTLDSTYERILLLIPDDYRNDATVVFALLMCAPKPITIGEAAEATAVEPETEIFDKRNRLRDPLSILKICSSFVSSSRFQTLRSTFFNSDETDVGRMLLFAHYSAKEYLISERAPHCIPDYPTSSRRNYRTD
jgi:ankyrin repeat domain-containing protein 50